MKYVVSELKSEPCGKVKQLTDKLPVELMKFSIICQSTIKGRRENEDYWVKSKTSHTNRGKGTLVESKKIKKEDVFLELKKIRKELQSIHEKYQMDCRVRLDRIKELKKLLSEN